jgi:transposase
VSQLESIDKETCYRIDKHILTRLLQGYKIPKVTRISVDEVYARSPRQMKEDEDRDDLFLTVIVDLKTHKVIWVSQSRKKEALDEFFSIIGEKGCAQIEVVACDQHKGYSASVMEHCPEATIVWDRFHLVQQFNEALNEDRRAELEKMDPEGKMAEEMQDLMNNKYRYIFLTKAKHRSEADRLHFEEVARINERIIKLELIKEHFHKVFDCQDEKEAQILMADVYQWAFDAQAWNIWKWVSSIRGEQRLWNYFRFKVTTAVSEGVNRVIKGLKWQAYGYKDMFYFALKILQKVGYLNSQYHFQKLTAS